MIFKKPCFVTQHAIEQFQKRFINISPKEIIDLIQKVYNSGTLPIDAKVKSGKLSLLFRGSYQEKYFCFPVIQNEDQEWPCVPTVVPDKLFKLQLIRKNHYRWSRREALVLPYLIKIYTIEQCCYILGRSHTTIEKHIKEQKLIRRPINRWNEKDREKLYIMYSQGKSYEYIAKKLNRSINAIKIQLSRHRQNIKNDPEKQRVLKVLSFCMNPGRVLKTVRDMRLLDEIRKLEIEEGL